MILLIIYLIGVLIAFNMMIKLFYDDWKQGMDTQFHDLFLLFLSLMSWYFVIILFCIKHWDDVVIKGKSDDSAR